MEECKQSFTFAGPEAVDWEKFREWLQSQYSRQHTSDLLNNSMKFKDAIFDAKSAAQLKALTPSKRRHAMQSLSALPKFLGAYDSWKEMQRQADLKWAKTDAVSIVKAILSQSSEDAFQWLEEIALPGLPKIYRPPMIYIALSGLRASEACESLNLILQMNPRGDLYSDFEKEGGYIDKDLSMVCHYKFPKTFLRGTKNRFLSFVSPNLINHLIDESENGLSYRAIETALLRYDCLPRQTKGLRSHYATSLKKALDREMIDLLQGRIDASVFVRNYYRPLLVQLRDKVLEATKPLEEELLTFL
jgi:hypothetical protein